MRQLRDRFYKHLHPEVPQYVHNHFRQSRHSTNDMTITPLQKVFEKLPISEARHQLIKLETLWIKRLDTTVPKGLNVLEEDTHSRYDIEHT